VKQKNMLLVAVAVGCGLVAAILTSQLAAGGKKKDEETVAVLVTVKDLPVGTWLRKDQIDEFVDYKDVPKSAAPAEFIGTKDEVADKRIIRTLRKGESFNPKDVSKQPTMAPPIGYDMMAIACTLEEGVAGFVQPGSKVNILASIPSKRQGDRATVVTFMLDMLVLAVDGTATITPDANSVISLNMVSFAVTPKQAELLHGAKGRGCLMRLVLCNLNGATKHEKVYTDKELWALLADMPNAEPKSNGGDQAPKVAPDLTPAVEKIKLAVAREDIAAGTELTDEIITAKFEMKEFTKPAPTSGIEDPRKFTGKYLTKDLVAGQFLPKSFLGADPTAKPKAAPSDTDTTKEAEKTEAKAPVVPPKYHDVILSGPNGTKKIRYQEMPDGSYKFLGEVPLVEAKDDKAEEPKTEPKAAPKAEPTKPQPKPTPAPAKGDKKEGDPI
jgi:pilus assembly protein CpaB